MNFQTFFLLILACGAAEKSFCADRSPIKPLHFYAREVLKETPVPYCKLATIYTLTALTYWGVITTMNKLNPDDTNSEMKNIAKACYFSAVSTASGIVGGIFEKALAKKFAQKQKIVRTKNRYR